MNLHCCGPAVTLELHWGKQVATSRVTSTTLKNMWTDLEYTHETMKQAATSRVTSTTLKNMWTDLENTHDTCQDTHDAAIVKCKLLSAGTSYYLQKYM